MKFLLEIENSFRIPQRVLKLFHTFPYLPLHKHIYMYQKYLNRIQLVSRY